MVEYSMHAPVYGANNPESFEKKDFSSKVALIDADYLKYLVTSSMYKKIMEEGLSHSKSMLNEVIDYYLSREVFKNYSAKAYVFCFSCPSKQVFRNHITQEKKYKGNRENQKDYTPYPDKYDDMAYVYQYVKERYITLFYNDLEADDLVSFLQDKENTFICSVDKDLEQVEGYHFDLKNRVLKYTDARKGCLMLFSQVLLGDTVDNFSGLKGFGKKSLVKMFDSITNKNVDFSAYGDISKLSISFIVSRYPELDHELMLHSCIKKFVEKYGVLNGADTFVEMWNIASMKINRGDYFKEKYASAIKTVNELIES